MRCVKGAAAELEEHIFTYIYIRRELHALCIFIDLNGNWLVPLLYVLVLRRGQNSNLFELGRL